MKLFSRLFCVLLGIFILGIVAVCMVNSTSVWSRIATGLITGSFVGLINALTNYFHTRQVYFEKMVMSLLEMESNLGNDYIQSTVRNEFIAGMSKNQMIDYASHHEKIKDTIAESEKIHKRYQDLASKFDFEAYAPLIPYTRGNIKSILEKLENLISFEILCLYGEYQSCYYFSFISSPATKEGRLMCIGNPDEFFDHVVQNNKDYQDLLAFYLNSLASILASLSTEISGFVSKMYKDILSDLSSEIRHSYLHNVVIRDVRAERIDGRIEQNRAR